MFIRPSQLFKITAFIFFICISNSVWCSAEQPSAPLAEVIQIPASPLPFILQGFLRRPEGVDRPPAVVLLPICDEYAKPLDENWGARISSWGYVTLTIDSFGPRGIRNCGRSAPYPDLAFDAYRGLDFLINKGFVDPKRVAIVGFAWGSWQTISAVERGAIEQASKNKFRAAVAFYPPCGGFKGIMTVPTLILIGERDDWNPEVACRKMVAGEDDIGISRQKGEGAPVKLIVYPDAYHLFDVPSFQTPIQNLGHHLEFNKSAAAKSSEATREFLHAVVVGSQ
jgi:dienelactone hydrolase